MGRIQTVVMHGKPGCGKGTQGKLLAENLGWYYSATGDLFRDAERSLTPIGRSIKEAMATGELLPSSFTEKFLVESLERVDASSGIVLDGYARTLEQAKNLDHLLGFLERPYAVIHLDVSDAIAMKRMRARHGQTSRTDSDTDEKIRRRLRIYNQESKPAYDFFYENQRLYPMVGARPVDAVQGEILKIVQY